MSPPRPFPVFHNERAIPLATYQVCAVKLVFTIGARAPAFCTLYLQTIGLEKRAL